MVPLEIQRLVYRYYRVGQCEDKQPSENWHRAADRAIQAVAMQEGRAVSSATAATAIEVFDLD